MSGGIAFGVTDLRYSFYISEEEVREISGIGLNGTIAQVLDKVELSVKVSSLCCEQ